MAPETAVTLRDVLDILLGRVKDLAEDQRALHAKQEELAENQQRLVESTNHKIDELRKQGLRIMAAVLIVGTPILINNWAVLVTQLNGIF